MTQRVPPDNRETLARPPRWQRTPPTPLILWGLGLAFLGLVLAVVFLSVYLVSLTQRTPTTLIVDGEPQQIYTRARTVDDLLDRAQVNLEAGDTLSTSLDTPVTANMVITLERARDVTLWIDGQRRVYRTTQRYPAQILSDLAISLAADDEIMLDGIRVQPQALAAWTIPVEQIHIERAVEVEIIDGQNSPVRVRTTGQTVGDALYAAQVTLYLADAVVPDVSTPLQPDMRIAIERSVPARVIADGMTLETRSRARSVGELLADAGVALIGLDYSIPGEEVTVQPGMTIRVIRVREELISQNEVIAFESVTQADASLEIDQVRVVQAGENGLRRTDVRVRYENGIEVSREVSLSDVVRRPQNRVVTYGTGIVLRDIETEQGVRQYWRRVRMYATSYHPAALGGDNITATGRVLTKGIVGVDPKLIPYGSEIFVPGYGVGVAADTGPPRGFSRWVDLGYDDANWVSWSQYVDVYFLAPVPANIQYILPE